MERGTSRPARPPVRTGDAQGSPTSAPPGPSRRRRCGSPPATLSSSRCRCRRSTPRSRRSRTGTADRALVPFENSIEGTVRPTLDALAFDTERVRIVGEFDHDVHQMLIAGGEIALERIERVLSHPQPIAQCAGVPARAAVRRRRSRPSSSTSEAVRRVVVDGAGGSRGPRSAPRPPPRPTDGVILARERRGRERQRDPLRLARARRQPGRRPRIPAPPGGRRSSSSSSATTTPAPSSMRSRCSPTGRST